MSEEKPGLAVGIFLGTLVGASQPGFQLVMESTELFYYLPPNPSWMCQGVFPVRPLKAASPAASPPPLGVTVLILDEGN